jgi:uncharacterized protein YukJ
MRRKPFHRKRFHRPQNGGGPRGYGVLKGRVRGTRREVGGATPHYHILLLAGGLPYRVAVNVQSTATQRDLLALLDPDFRRPITVALGELSEGFYRLPPRPGGLALDYVRGDLFDPSRMEILPATLAGPHNDLGDQLDEYLARALIEPDARLYAFGMRWGPERRRDPVFGFRPANGLHNVHMNQGNAPGHAGEDGVWQDGGLLIQFPATDQWVGLFLAFQSQSWQTDDRTGHMEPLVSQ